VRLDLERDGDAVADVNDAGVFLARADEDLRRLGGEGFEQRLGVFVAAMLAPHHGKDAELGVARRAAEDFHGVGVFFRREVVLGNQLWGDGGFGHGKILIKCDCLNGFVKCCFFVAHQPNCWVITETGINFCRSLKRNFCQFRCFSILSSLRCD